MESWVSKVRTLTTAPPRRAQNKLYFLCVEPIMIIQKLELKIQQRFSIQKSTLQIRYFSTHKQNNLKSKLEKIMILKTISLSKLCRDETGIMAY